MDVIAAVVHAMPDMIAPAVLDAPDAMAVVILDAPDAMAVVILDALDADNSGVWSDSLNFGSFERLPPINARAAVQPVARPVKNALCQLFETGAVSNPTVAPTKGGLHTHFRVRGMSAATA